MSNLFDNGFDANTLTLAVNSAPYVKGVLARSGMWSEKVALPLYAKAHSDINGVLDVCQIHGRDGIPPVEALRPLLVSRHSCPLRRKSALYLGSL